jgi:hypothetical protein
MNMKKALLFASLSIAGMSFGQCNEIFISEYVEGSGNNKALELYNPTGAPINLSGYSIERFSNGQATSSSGGVLNLSGTIAAHSAFVITNGQTVSQTNSPACDPALQAMADLLDGVYPAPTYMNGNDAIVLFKNGVRIDHMGKSGDASMSTADGWSDEFPYDGSAGEVWTEDHTLIRKASVMQGVSVNPDPFIVTQEWDSLPEDTWTNLGTHVCNCPLAVNEEVSNVSFVVYPNPIGNGMVTVNASENIVSVTVISMTGEVVRVAANSSASKMIQFSTEGLGKGVYMVNVNYGDAFSVSTSNLVVQ